LGASDAEPIDLAHTPDFILGRLNVRPAVRQLIRHDGAEEVLEPRVMQVLLALVRAEGGIVTRDELTSSCWDDRVVGEDAINRVISRLRRSAEGIGAGSFRIETITKVGYRLIRGDSAPRAAAPAPAPAPAPRHSLSRRAVVGGAVAVVGGVAASGLLFWRHARKRPSQHVQDLMVAGLAALGQSTNDGELQARGMFRRVTQIAPDYAPGWGALAMLYSVEAHYYPPGEGEASRARTREISARALALDPDESYARAAQSNLLPFNRWLAMEPVLRDGLKRDPDNMVLLQWLGRLLARVGRMGEAADALERAVAAQEGSAINIFDLMIWQWAAGRLEDADQTVERGLQLFPRNFAVWFGAFYIKLFTGRLDEAIAMAQDLENRPASVGNGEVDGVLAVAQALRSHDPAAIDAQTDIWLGKAHQAAGYAENAMQFLATFGRKDEAFAVIDAYFLDRGWSVPSLRFPNGQGSFTYLPDRRTNYLFEPSLRSLWHDPRFDALLDAVGLTRYWHESGTQPDYRKA